MSSSEKSLLLQTAVLHIHGQAEREDALHSLAILGLFKYLELTDDVVVDCETLHLILAKTNGLFRQLLARRSNSILNTATSTATKSTTTIDANNNNNKTNTNSSNNNNDDNINNKSNKKQGSHRANLTSHFPFADSQGSVLEILKEGSSDLISSKATKASAGLSEDVGMNSNKHNNGADGGYSTNNRGHEDDMNSGKATKQVRISDINNNYKSYNSSSNSSSRNNSNNNKNNNNSNKGVNNAVKSKGSGMSECAFLSMGLPARIRLAKKVFGEFKSGNTGMQLKDVPEAVRCLGIPVSRTLDRACSRFNSRQSINQGKGNNNKRAAEKDFYVIDKSINLDQWLKLISRYTTRNAYMDKLSSGEEKMSSRDDNDYRAESDSGNSLLHDDADEEEVAVSDGTDSDYNSYGEETLRRFIIDPDDDDVALAISAERKTRIGTATDVSEAFGDAFGSVASAAARHRSAALSQRATYPFAPPHVVPSSGSRERERERPQSAKTSYSNYSSSTSPSAYSQSAAARGSKTGKAVTAAAKQGREGAEYLSKIRGVKSAIGDRIRADRSYYNKNSEFVSHSALSSVARRRVKQLVEKPLPFILSDDDEEDDNDDCNGNRGLKTSHIHRNSRHRSDSARRKEYSRLRDVASGSAVRMIADSFLDSSLAREMLGHRSKYSGADPSLEQDYSFGSYESEDSRQAHQYLYKSVRDRVAPLVSLGEGMDSSNSLDEEIAREELNYLIPNMSANNNNNNNNNSIYNNNGNLLASTITNTHLQQVAAAATTTTRPDAIDTTVDSKDKIYISSKASKNGWSADFGHGIASNKNKNNKNNKNNKDADDSSGKFLSTYELGIKPWNRVVSKIPSASSSASSTSSLLLSHSKDVSIDVYTSRPPSAALSSRRHPRNSSELDTVHVLDASASDDDNDNDNYNDNDNDANNSAIDHQSGTAINSSSMQLNTLGDSIRTSLALKDVV